MDNLKVYQICHHLITYFATLISKKSQLGPIFRTGGSITVASSKKKNYSLFFFKENYPPTIFVFSFTWKKNKQTSSFLF